jgi:hypothetical protein
VTDLDDLSTDDLRERAFERARRDHDLGFVWEIARHLRASRAIAGEDGSSGSLTGTVAEAVEVVRELMGRGPLAAEDEPLLRARFLDYLRA